MPPETTPTTPLTPPQASPPKSSRKARLSSLNWPQRLLALTAAVLALLLLSLAVYQLFHKEPAPALTLSAPAQATVAITKNGLTPATITIKAGTQLTWTNNDQKSHQPAPDPHPTNDSIPGFESDTTLLSGDSLSFTFETSGTYTLHDHLNPLEAKYRLTVVVE